MTKTIKGRVILQRGNDDGACVCCEGSHVFARYIQLDAFTSSAPSHFRRDVELWIEENFNFKELEGRSIEITAKLLPEEKFDDKRPKPEGKE